MVDFVDVARSEARCLIERERVRNGTDEASYLRQSPEYRAAITLEEAAARIDALEARVAAADKLAEDVLYLCQCADNHADKFPVPSHLRELTARIRAAYEATKEQSDETA